MDKLININLVTLSSEKYPIILNVNAILNSTFLEFNQYILTELSKTELKSKLDNSFIKYIYNNNIINRDCDNYKQIFSQLENNTNITIILQDLPKVYSTNNYFIVDTNNDTILLGYSEVDDPKLSEKFNKIKYKIKNIKKFSETYSAIAILDENGNIITCGRKEDGGDSSEVDEKLINIKQIFNTDGAFAAINEKNEVITWGNNFYGSDSTNIKLNNIEYIFSTISAFAAINDKGDVITWGDPNYGGDSSRVILKNIKYICANELAFAAINDKGNVITWGDQYNGGDSSSVQSKLKKITKIYSTIGAFAAINEYGEVITWGHRNYGGDTNKIKSKLINIKKIYTIEKLFLAINKKNNCIIWGNSRSPLIIESYSFDFKYIYTNDLAFCINTNNNTFFIIPENYSNSNLFEFYNQIHAIKNVNQIINKEIYLNNNFLATLDINNCVIIYDFNNNMIVKSIFRFVKKIYSNLGFLIIVDEIGNYYFID